MQTTKWELYEYQRSRSVIDLGPNHLHSIFLNFFSSITADFNTSSAIRWAIQDQWSSGYQVLIGSIWSRDYGTFRPPLYTHSSNTHAKPSSWARCLIFCQTLRLLPCPICVNSDELAHFYWWQWNSRRHNDKSTGITECFLSDWPIRYN